MLEGTPRKEELPPFSYIADRCDQFATSERYRRRQFCRSTTTLHNPRMPNDQFTGHLRRSLISSLEEKRSPSNSDSPNPSVLSLFIDQNEGFAKSDVRKNVRLR